jgi:uncharacterized repeat protein (TIGR01451 family)
MDQPMKFKQFLIGLIPVLLCIMALGGVPLAAQPASAQPNGGTVEGDLCMQKIYMSPSTTVTQSNKLNCTANDIRLSRAISVSPDTCTKGTTFDLTATFEVIVTANSRYDAGFFFRVDGGETARGDGSAVSGQCSLSWLTPGVSPALSTDNPSADTDSCGDLNAGTYYVTFLIPGVYCQALEGTDQLRLPNCTSWHSNQGTLCSAPAGPSDPHVNDFHPDTKSKCVCDDYFTVPVTVEDATLTVDKSASPASVPEPGGTVTYTVTITNRASIESVTIQTLIDDIYGNLHVASNSVTDNTCPDLVGYVLGPGASKSCSFKVYVEGNSGDKITDTVEVCSIQPSKDNTQVCGHDDATVDITEVFTEPTLTKTVQSATCQMDVTYQVVVNNNSLVDTLTINSLTDDKFGDITTAHGAGGEFGQVVSTTCSLPQPAIDAGDNFTCTFVGRISNSCNFTHTNTVTGNVTDDDAVTSTPQGSATVSVSTRLK